MFAKSVIDALSAEQCDFTINGNCIQCGECCGRFLPVSEMEIRSIKRYVKKHNIKPCKHDALSAVPAFDLNCPFLDTNKSKEKCRIYEARPLICKLYKCDGNMEPEAEKQFKQQQNIIGDMWNDIFPEGCK